jgi:hypothetical protein
MGTTFERLNPQVIKKAATTKLGLCRFRLCDGNKGQDKVAMSS